MRDALEFQNMAVRIVASSLGKNDDLNIKTIDDIVALVEQLTIALSNQHDALTKDNS